MDWRRAADHLAELLIEAPYRAAARVFDVALQVDADFVVLAGNLVDPHRAGPRGLAFLADQFARLAERGIAVYWATGPTDHRADWPTTLTWPPNVHLLSGDLVDYRIHSRRGEPICQIVGYPADGASADGNSSADHLSTDLFSLAILPAPCSLAPSAFTAATHFRHHFWAFGGLPEAATPLVQSEGPCVAHCSGTPQGRTPAEIGPHGCTVVHVDDQRHVRLTPIATDAVRWRHERIDLTAGLQRADLERLLHQRMQALIGADADRTLMIRWTIGGSNPLLARARQTGLTAEWLARLRTEYGLRTPAAWSVSLDVEPPDAIPEAWYQQQTLLGEYLRAIRTIELPGAEGPDLQPLYPASLLNNRGAELAAQCVAMHDPAARSAVLRQAALLGAELLRPDDLGHKEPTT